MTTDVFTASGTFTPPAGVTTVDVLVVGGGGGGGHMTGTTDGGGGGGGGGGVRWVPAVAVTPGVPVTVTVGGGGAKGAAGTRGTNGGTTSFDTTAALGGGGGGGSASPSGAAGGSGGGGCAFSSTAYAGGAGTAGQGNNGGTGYTPGPTGSTRASGGGGGAGAVGANAGSSAGGAGGAGVDQSANVGTAVGEAGWFGGGGGGRGSSSGGTGGQGGGGNGTTTSGQAGDPNTGGGGGGARTTSTPGDGGSGLVVVVYTIPDPDPVNPNTEGWTVFIDVTHPSEGLVQSYRVQDDDPPPGPVADLPGQGVLSDVLGHHRSLPEGVPWPCQPDPERLEFNVVAADASTATLALVKGAVVVWHFYAPRLPTDWEFPPTGLAEPVRLFLGRVSEVATEALEEGVQVAVSAVDWTASLAEAVIGDAPWAEENSKQRLERILDLVNTDYPTIPGTVAPAGGPHDPDMTDWAARVPVIARDVDAQPALGLVQEVLSAWAFDVDVIEGVPVTPEPARYQLDIAPGIDSTPSGWIVTPRLAASLLPATEVPADQVELSSKWVQRLASAITTVALTVKDGTTDKIIRRKVAGAVVDDTYSLAVPLDYNDPGTAGPPVTYDGVGASTRLANMLRPTVAVTANAWQAEEFAWLLDQAEAGAMVPDLGELVTVTGIKAGANPTGTDTVEGLLDSDHFTIRDGKPAVSFTLRPRSRA